MYGLDSCLLLYKSYTFTSVLIRSKIMYLHKRESLWKYVVLHVQIFMQMDFSIMHKHNVVASLNLFFLKKEHSFTLNFKITNWKIPSGQIGNLILIFNRTDICTVDPF